MACGVHITSISFSFTVQVSSFSLTAAVWPLSNAIVCSFAPPLLSKLT